MTKVIAIDQTRATAQLKTLSNRTDTQEVFPKIEFVSRANDLVLTIFWRADAGSTQEVFAQLISYFLERSEVSDLIETLAPELAQQLNHHQKGVALNYHLPDDKIHAHDERRAYFNFHNAHPHFHLLFRLPPVQHTACIQKILASLNYIAQHLRSPNIKGLFFACSFRKVIRLPINITSDDSMLDSLTHPKAKQMAPAFFKGYGEFSQRPLLTLETAALSSNKSTAGQARATASLFHRKVTAASTFLQQVNAYRGKVGSLFFNAIDEGEYNRALRRACTNKDQKTVLPLIKLMLKHQQALGLDPTQTNKSGQSAISLAREHQHHDILRLLGDPQQSQVAPVNNGKLLPRLLLVATGIMLLLYIVSQLLASPSNEAVTSTPAPGLH